MTVLPSRLTRVAPAGIWTRSAGATAVDSSSAVASAKDSFFMRGSIRLAPASRSSAATPLQRLEIGEQRAGLRVVEAGFDRSPIAHRIEAAGVRTHLGAEQMAGVA